MSMFASLAGTDMQGIAQYLTKKDMFRTYEAQQAAQQEYAKQALGVFNDYLPKFGADTAKGQIQQGATSRQNLYSQAQAVPLGVKNPMNQRDIAAASMRAATQGQNRANYKGYGDWQFNQGQQSLNEQRAMAPIMSFASGSSNVFPYQMYAAQHGWDALSEAGAAIASIGGAAANMAQYGQGPNTSGSRASSGQYFSYPGNGGYDSMPSLYNIPGGAGGIDPSTGQPLMSFGIV